MRAKLIAAIALAAALGATATVTAVAATNLNSSKSNIYRVATPKDEDACKAAGGKVETKDGEKVCSVPFVGGALAQ